MKAEKFFCFYYLEQIFLGLALDVMKDIQAFTREVWAAEDWVNYQGSSPQNVSHPVNGYKTDEISIYGFLP